MTEDPRPRNDEDQEDDLTAAAFSESVPGPALLRDREFQPWHLPRKQFVRIDHWCANIHGHIKELGLGNNQPYTYLSLPGDDLLDIRALRGVFERTGNKLRFLGYNSVGRGSIGEVALTASESELLGAQFVDGSSRVKRDRIESILNQKSIGKLNIENQGPFHAINLDFCQSLLASGENRKVLYTDLLRELIEFQRRRAAHPWLLFLTTRVERDKIASSTLDELSNVVRDNLKSSGDFANEFWTTFPTPDNEVDKEYWSSLDDFFHLVFTALALTKWLVCLSSTGYPSLELTLMRCSYYSVYGGQPDMLSMVFRFEIPWSPGRDRLKAEISTARENTPAVSEIDCAIRALRSLSSMLDVDALLRADGKEREKCIRQSKELLQQAGYILDHYDEFCEGYFRKGS